MFKYIGRLPEVSKHYGDVFKYTSHRNIKVNYVKANYRILLLYVLQNIALHSHERTIYDV